MYDVPGGRQPYIFDRATKKYLIGPLVIFKAVQVRRGSRGVFLGRRGSRGAPEESQGDPWGEGRRPRDLMEMKQCFPT